MAETAHKAEVQTMYIPHELRQAEYQRLLSLDMVSRLEVEAAVEGYVKVQARVEAVATVLANLQDQFKGVEAYSWHVYDWRINLTPPKPGMEHLARTAVHVKLTALRRENEYEDELVRIGRSGSIQEDNFISRSVDFPVEFLTSENWMEMAEKEAKRRELWFLKYHARSTPEAIQERRESALELEKRHALNLERIAQLEAEGIVVELP